MVFLAAGGARKAQKREAGQHRVPGDAIQRSTELETAQEGRFGFPMWLPYAEKSKAVLGPCLLLPVVAESSWLADLPRPAPRRRCRAARGESELQSWESLNGINQPLTKIVTALNEVNARAADGRWHGAELFAA